MSPDTSLPTIVAAQRWRTACILAGWLLLAGFVVSAAVLGDYRVQVRWFQAAWAFGFVGYALILAAVWSLPAESIPGRWSWWMGGFVLLRVALVSTVPSDDLHRYAWEGRIQRYGFNPFMHAPDDERLEALRAGDENWVRINHPDYPAIYPPLAQLVFRAIATVSTSVLAMKVCFLGIDVAVVAALGSFLRGLGVSPYRSVIYALCPLTLFAFALEGHVDALMLLALVLAARAAQRGRMTACGIALGLAIAAKLVAVVMLAWLAVRRPRAALVAVVTVAITYLPYLDAGRELGASLLRFGRTTNLGPFAGYLAALTDPGAVRIGGAVGLLLFLVWLLWKRSGFTEYAARAFAALVLVLPVLHVWYLTWVLLFAWARLRWSWLVLAAAMGVCFEAERVRVLTGTWAMPVWVAPTVAGMFAAAWIAERVSRHRARLDA